MARTKGAYKSAAQIAADRAHRKTMAELRSNTAWEPDRPVTLAPVHADTSVQLDLVDYLWGLKLQRELNGS